MEKRKTTFRIKQKQQSTSVHSMPKWKAWLLISALASLGGLLLWYGLAIDVRCERVSDSQVDITISRCFYKLIPLSSTTLTDVVKADVYYAWARTSSGGRQKRGFTESLELIPRSGPLFRRARFGPSVGTLPGPMVSEINQFIKDPSAKFLKLSWMPWLVNIAAIPFVLFAGAVVAEKVWRFFHRDI